MPPGLNVFIQTWNVVDLQPKNQVYELVSTLNRSMETWMEGGNFLHFNREDRGSCSVDSFSTLEAFDFFPASIVGLVVLGLMGLRGPQTRSWKPAPRVDPPSAPQTLSDAPNLITQEPVGRRLPP